MQHDVLSMHNAACKLRKDTVFIFRNTRAERLRQTRRFYRNLIFMRISTAQPLCHPLTLRITAAHLKRIYVTVILFTHDIIGILHHAVYLHGGKINHALYLFFACKLKEIFCALKCRHDRFHRMIHKIL